MKVEWIGMTYVAVTDGTPDVSRRIRGSEQRLDTEQWIQPHNGEWSTAEAAACGFYPLVRNAKPADTATDTYERSWVFDGTSVVETWTERPWTAEESAARQTAAERQARDTKLRNAIATLETWSAQAAAAPAVTQGTALARIDTITDNLGTFYGHFADLLRNQYGIDD